MEKKRGSRLDLYFYLVSVSSSKVHASHRAQAINWATDRLEQVYSLACSSPVGSESQSSTHTAGWLHRRSSKRGIPHSPRPFFLAVNRTVSTELLDPLTLLFGLFRLYKIVHVFSGCNQSSNTRVWKQAVYTLTSVLKKYILIPGKLRDRPESWGGPTVQPAFTLLKQRDKPAALQLRRHNNLERNTIQNIYLEFITKRETTSCEGTKLFSR